LQRAQKLGIHSLEFSPGSQWIKIGGGEPLKDCSDCPAVAVTPVRIGDNNSYSYLAAGVFEVTNIEYVHFLRELKFSSEERDALVATRTSAPWPMSYLKELIGSKDEPKLITGSDGVDLQGNFELYPVVGVSYIGAIKYVAFLNCKIGSVATPRRGGMRACIEAQVNGGEPMRPYRLPSLAEWQAVAAAGTNTDYWWGVTEGRKARARCADCLIANTFDKAERPTRSFEPNPWGLWNVHGNAAEWTSSCAAPIVDRPKAKKQVAQTKSSPMACGNYLVAGGGWNQPKTEIKANAAVSVAKDQKLTATGFRVVREVEQSR
jgi:formylglycine-generating enzyme required for sulfatase activity